MDAHKVVLFSNYYTAATAKDVAGDSDNDEDGYVRLLETEDGNDAASDGSSDNGDGYLMGNHSVKNRAVREM